MNGLNRRLYRIALSAVVFITTALIGSGVAAADRSNATDDDQVARLYFGVFNRAPDLYGEVFWNYQLASGMALEEVASNFVRSDEFLTTYGQSWDRETFVRALYRNILGREGEPTGVRQWTDRLAAGYPPERLVIAFTESDEFKARAVTKPSRYDEPDCGTAFGDGFWSGYTQLFSSRHRTLAAVLDLSSNCGMMASNPSTMGTVASTFKLAVMGAVLLRAQDRGRGLSAAEQRDLGNMIQYSDDNMVGPYMASFGGPTAMLNSYGPRLGIGRFDFVPERRWGCYQWSAETAAQLAAHLVVEEITPLDPTNRYFATVLMGSVTNTQRWGLGHASDRIDAGLAAFQKNGFARQCSRPGAQLNSVGVVFGTDGEPQAAIAIMTTGWIDGAPASRSDDTPAYVDQGGAHITALASHLIRSTIFKDFYLSAG